MSKEVFIKSKILNKEELQRALVRYKLFGKRIVFTNGCFDILHRGHVEYLAKAADLGDILIVGLNTDESVRRIKGKQRPIQDQEARALVLAALQCVDHIILFNEDTPYELIKFIKPHILIKGKDYKKEEIVGYDIVKENGGDVITIELTEGYSTSDILDKLTK